MRLTPAPGAFLHMVFGLDWSSWLRGSDPESETHLGLSVASGPSPLSPPGVKLLLTEERTLIFHTALPC